MTWDLGFRQLHMQALYRENYRIFDNKFKLRCWQTARIPQQAVLIGNGVLNFILTSIICCLSQRAISQFNKFNYTLPQHTLEHDSSAKYLGVTFNNTTQAANRTLGFFHRNLQMSNPSYKEKDYKSLVRPLAEYASTAWDPHAKQFCSFPLLLVHFCGFWWNTAILSCSAKDHWRQQLSPCEFQ